MQHGCPMTSQTMWSACPVVFNTWLAFDFDSDPDPPKPGSFLRHFGHLVMSSGHSNGATDAGSIQKLYGKIFRNLFFLPIIIQKLTLDPDRKRSRISAHLVQTERHSTFSKSMSNPVCFSNTQRERERKRTWNKIFDKIFKRKWIQKLTKKWMKNLENRGSI